MLVVNAPKATRTNTHTLAKAAKTASRGWCVAVRGGWEDKAMNNFTQYQKLWNCRPQTL
jgi:hypothetical protein